MTGDSSCIFCKIIEGSIPAARVFENEHVLVFLDNGPLFPGHCLVCPKVHYATLLDLPPDLLAPLYQVVQKVCSALETNLEAAGSFVAVNNKISQSVPHLHVHVVPRKPKDGLKGFFWPRKTYKNPEEMESIRQRLADALQPSVPSA